MQNVPHDIWHQTANKITPTKASHSSSDTETKKDSIRSINRWTAWLVEPWPSWILFIGWDPVDSPELMSASVVERLVDWYILVPLLAKKVNMQSKVKSGFFLGFPCRFPRHVVLIFRFVFCFCWWRFPAPRSTLTSCDRARVARRDPWKTDVWGRTTFPKPFWEGRLVSAISWIWRSVECSTK